MNLSNKTILITGANGGVGRSLIRYCLEHKAKKIYCCARDITKLADINDTNTEIELCQLDITDINQIKVLAKSIDMIDILINNAGVNTGKRVFEETISDFEVNLFGTLNVCRELHKKIPKGGSIINITSIVALVNLPSMGLYCASKSALHSLSQAMRAELATSQITVYEVLPGPIDTNMTKGQIMEKTSPEEIVSAIFKGYENREYEIYPDPFAREIKIACEDDYKSIELSFAHSVQE